MEKHTISGFITFNASAYSNEPKVSFSTYAPSAKYSPSTVIVREHSFEVDVPDDFDARPQRIDALKEQQRQAAAEFAKLCTDIQRQISELTCLEAA